MGTQIAASDLTWLLMDRPNNLMHVHGIWEFDELPELEEVRQAVLDRVVTKYRVLSQVPVQRHGRWEWADDVDFEIERHVYRVVLEDSRPETLRAYVASVFATPFDRSVPLWDTQIVSGPPDDGPGGVILSRFHHGLGDGIRLVQLVLGMCDPKEGAVPPKVGKEHHGVIDRVLHVTQHTIKDSIDYFQHAGDAVAKVGRQVWATANPLELPHHFETALDLARHPVRLIDALTSVTEDDNEISNSWREIGRLLLHEKADAGAWSGHPGIEKRIDWLADLELARIQKTAKTYGVTVNDVLTSLVSMALTDYLVERGVEQVHDLAWMMPVSLQPIDGRLPDELGNHFCVVLFEMPLGMADPEALMEEVHHRATRLKNSAEPAVAFGMQWVVAEAPSAIAKRLTDHFSGKTIGQLSNVPGPRTELSFVGKPIRAMLGWVPTSGDQPIGLCLFSYNGTVGVGVATDARMIPDPERILALVREHYDKLIGAVGERPDPSRRP
ncbi:MAG: hypothetical protein CSA84_01515 [Actinomycetales bacterium]|nr:MAG: hypothetical protein CSA84_01515 [Actinomycetales bacterium]